jgi:hypothetical protein
MDENVLEVKLLVSNGQVEEALQLLLELVKGDKESEVTALLLLAEHSEIAIQANRGTITQEDLRKRKTVLNENILKAANQLLSGERRLINLPNVYERGKSPKKGSFRFLIVLNIIILSTFFSTSIYLATSNPTSSSKSVAILALIYIATMYGSIIVFSALVISLLINTLRK